jgi:serine protease Do
MSNGSISQRPGRRPGWLAGGGIAAVIAALLGFGGWRMADVSATSAPAQVSVAQPARVSAAPVASYAGVVDKVAPAVVTIRTERRSAVIPTAQQLPPELRDFFGRGFGAPQPRGHERALGSGVIVTGDGYILTNNHVVEDATAIRVELPDRRALDAKLVGADPASDLAVLKVAAKDLHVLPLGDSDRVRVGDVVLAVGNPLGLGQTVTMGIISGKGRQTGSGDGSFEDFLQTDAPINQGNSGGALVNLNGELVGINSQILSPSGGNIGVGFAIPANMARNVMDQLIKTGTVHRAKLGVTAQTITSDLAASLGLQSLNGALVSNVEPGSPAARAGVQQGDVILEVNGRPVADSNALRNEVAGTVPGSDVKLTVQRNGTRHTLSAKLAELRVSRTKHDENSGDDESPSGRYGLSVQPITPDLADELDLPRGTKGLAVVDIDPAGAAADAGLQQGDVIERVNGHDVRSSEELRSALAQASQRPALLLVNRKGNDIFLTLRAPAA